MACNASYEPCCTYEFQCLVTSFILVPHRNQGSQGSCLHLICIINQKTNCSISNQEAFHTSFTSSGYSIFIFTVDVWYEAEAAKQLARFHRQMNWPRHWDDPNSYKKWPSKNHKRLHYKYLDDSCDPELQMIQETNG